MKILWLFLPLLFFTTVPALYHNVPYITTLQRRDFDKTIVDSHDLWIVEFYAKWCTHCQNYAKEFKKVARALKPHIKFAALNGVLEKSLSNKYDVEEFPTLLLFGFDKNKPVKVNLSLPLVIDSCVEAIREKSLQLLKPRFSKNLNVIELYDNTFNENVICNPKAWLIYFYEADCTKCADYAKTLLKVANQLKTRARINVGAINLKTNKIQGVETSGLRFLPYDRKSIQDFITYEGNFNFNDIIDWAEKNYRGYEEKPHVFQLLSEEVLRESCESKKLCILTFLPQLDDCESECRIKYLDLLRGFASEYSDEDWGWVWTQAEDQNEIETTLEIAELTYPIVAAVDVRNKTVGSISYDLTYDTLKAFFDGIANGTATLNKIETESYPTIELSKFWCDSNDDSNSDTEKEEAHDEL